MLYSHRVVDPLCRSVTLLPAVLFRVCPTSRHMSSDGGRRRLWRWGIPASPHDGTPWSMPKSGKAEKPTLIPEVYGVTDVACGAHHSAFIANKELHTFGSNSYGQLGRDADQKDNYNKSVCLEFGIAPLIKDGKKAVPTMVSLGAFHSAALDEDGDLYTWGWGGSFMFGAGALGLGCKSHYAEPAITDLSNVVQVVCGKQHTMALTSEGQIWATGKGDFGILGVGDTTDKYEFEEIDYFDLSNDSILHPDETPRIKKIGAGESFSAALSEQGELWVWGRNERGQLGLGEEAVGDMHSAERFPRLVRALPREGHVVTDFACGDTHIVALTSDGSLLEWGNSTWLEPHKLPKDEAYEDVVQIAAGQGCSLLLTGQGHVFAWGAVTNGCLPIEVPSRRKFLLAPTQIPAEVFGHQKVVGIVASSRRGLAITEEDTVSL